MKLLIDAQLPPRLADFLRAHGHDVLHTTELPSGNRSTDQEVGALADREGRIVVSKDADFRIGHLVNGSPERVLVVAVGNISNSDLLELIEAVLPTIEEAFEVADLVELRRDRLIIHDR